MQIYPAAGQLFRATRRTDEHVAADSSFSQYHEICIKIQLQIINFILCLCLWLRASLIYINNCPMRCNTKQFIYYSASSLDMFRVSTTPIMSTQNCNYSLQYCAAWPHWREAAAKKIWPVPEAVVTVLCTPDDGCGRHPKHVEWTCRIINRQLCVAHCRDNY